MMLCGEECGRTGTTVISVLQMETRLAVAPAMLWLAETCCRLVSSRKKNCEGKLWLEPGSGQQLCGPSTGVSGARAAESGRPHGG